MKTKRLSRDELVLLRAGIDRYTIDCLPPDWVARLARNVRGPAPAVNKRTKRPRKP